MTRRGWVILLVLFIVGRLFMLWGALNPDDYGRGGAPFTADVDVVFHDYASRIVDGDEIPYSEIEIEYPPGLIPFIVAPKLLSESYREAFVLMMFVVDVTGFLGVILTARRWGSFAGPMIWAAVVPLLGPLTYVRLDLVPAVAVIWAVERMARHRWFIAAFLIMLGAIAKLYPILLIPVAWAAIREDRDRKAFALGAAAGCIPLVPFIGVLDDAWGAVISQQAARGVHIESTFGSVALVASKLGVPIQIESSLTTYHLAGALGGPLDLLSNALALAAVAAAAWLTFGASRSVGRGVVALGILGLVLALLGVGSVFSPQFMIWIVASTAAAAAWRRTSPIPLVLVGAAAALTQIIYPFVYSEILAQTWPGVMILLARNVLIVLAGVLVFIKLVQMRRPASAASVS